MIGASDSFLQCLGLVSQMYGTYKSWEWTEYLLWRRNPFSLSWSWRWFKTPLMKLILIKGHICFSKWRNPVQALQYWHQRRDAAGVEELVQVQRFKVFHSRKTAKFSIIVQLGYEPAMRVSVTRRVIPIVLLITSVGVLFVDISFICILFHIFKVFSFLGKVACMKKLVGNALLETSTRHLSIDLCKCNMWYFKFINVEMRWSTESLRAIEGTCWWRRAIQTIETVFCLLYFMHIKVVRLEDFAGDLFICWRWCTTENGF